MGNRQSYNSEQSAAAQRPTILLADDEATARRMLNDALQKLGFDVREAADGEEALQMAMEGGVELLVLDYEMPHLTGADVCRRLRASERADLRGLPVIMLTAHVEESEEIDCLKAGANDFVTKPVSRDLLAARIQTQLRLHLMAGELRERNEELARWRAEHEADLAAAHAAQHALVPEMPPAVAGWTIETLYQPLIEIGGDVFGWRPAGEGRWLFWLADATGHGVAAALFTALAAQLFRQACDTGHEPALILQAVNREFHKIFAGRAILSACCALIDPEGALTFSGAGHPPLLIRRAGGTVEALGPHGTVLGLEEHGDFEQSQTALHRGEAALLYSDGLFAYKRPDGVRFSHESLREIVPGAPAGAAFFERLLRLLHQTSNGEPGEDDIAAIALLKG